jgi:hypothetical protein
MTRGPVGAGVDEPVEDTQAVLAAYRERKRQAMEAARTGPEEGIAPVQPSPPTPPQSAPSRPAQVGPEGGPPPSPHAPSLPPAPPVPPSTPPVTPSTSPVPTSPHPGGHGSTGGALEVQRPAAPALASPPGATLSPLGPSLRLSEALLKDRKVSLRGSPRARLVGVILLLLGLALAVVDRRQAAAGAPMDGLGLAAVALALAGVVTAGVGLVWPRSRRLAVRLAASQKEEWQRIQGETSRLQVHARIGLALAVAGLLGMVAGYTLLSLGVLVAGAALAAVGIPLLIVAHVRRGLARRLYVQTLVLSGLEASGLGSGAPDERVRPVIIALDRLLGALPEAEVKAFLATPQARAYLELVDEATRSQRGP